MTATDKPKRAKKLRKELAAKAEAKPPVVEPDQIDEYDEAAVKAMVAKTPEVRFRHASYFTDDEDRIIAASIKSRVQLYKVAASLKCSYNCLKKHIDNTPVLAEMVREAREIECGIVREAIDDLITMRHPQVVMWRAKQLMPNEFGDAVEAEEDDTRIVIGAIPDELIAEADRALALAAEKPPEVGLSAMIDPRAKEGSSESQKQPLSSVERPLSSETADQRPNDPDGSEEADDEADEDGDDFSDDGEFDDFGGGDDLGF